jgi:IS5 family transposase
MSFSEYDVTRRTRKGNFPKQIDQLIDWNAIEQAIEFITPRYRMQQVVRPIQD